MMSNEQSIPSTARWCLKAVVPEHVASVGVRETIHERMVDLPAWRAAVLKSDRHSVAITCSIFGDTRALAMEDCASVLLALDLPERAVQFEIADPSVYDSDQALIPDFVGLAEVADMLNVSKQYVSEEARKRSNWLPPPVARVKATPLWFRDEIATVAEQRSLAESLKSGQSQSKSKGKTRKRRARLNGSSDKSILDSEGQVSVGEHIASQAERFITAETS
jgi:hypothetical protein